MLKVAGGVGDMSKWRNKNPVIPTPHKINSPPLWDSCLKSCQTAVWSFAWANLLLRRRKKKTTLMLVSAPVPWATVGQKHIKDLGWIKRAEISSGFCLKWDQHCGLHLLIWGTAMKCEAVKPSFPLKDSELERYVKRSQETISVMRERQPTSSVELYCCLQKDNLFVQFHLAVIEIDWLSC